jgi:hypothetical protein
LCYATARVAADGSGAIVSITGLDVSVLRVTGYVQNSRFDPHPIREEWIGFTVGDFR